MPVQIYTLAELLAMKKRKRTKYFVTGLFQCGLYLIAGQAKTGKSLFGFHLGIALLRGEQFLGRRTQKCNILVVQNEEELTSTGEKLASNGLQEFEREYPEEYQELINSKRLLVAKDLDIGTDQDRLFKLVDENNVDCVVIDSLRASLTKSGVTEMDLASAAILYQLQKGFHERGAMGVIIHHANKSDNNNGKTNSFNGVGGTNAILGANDGVIKVQLNNENLYKGRETLDIFFYPRNDNPASFQAVYEEGEACFWTFKVLNDNSLNPNTAEIIKAILIHLNVEYERWKIDHPDCATNVYGCSTKQLCETLGIEKGILVPILNFMEKSEGIVRYVSDRRWVYAIPPEGSSLWFMVQEDEEKVKLQKLKEERYAAILEGILQCQSAEEYDKLREELRLSDEEKDELKKQFTEEHHKKINLFVNPPSFEEGDIVKLKNVNDDTQYVVTKIEFDMEMANNSYKKNRWKYHLNKLDKPVQHFDIEKIGTVEF
jgi:DNA-binding MarR family transcriptional regulator